MLTIGFKTIIRVDVKFTKKDFIATAALIMALPKSKRLQAFQEWCDKFVDDNNRFDEEKFANACGFKWVEAQSEYRPLERGEKIKATPKRKTPATRKVVSSEKIVTNFDSFNTIQNRYELKCVDKNMKYPAGLIEAATKDFEEWCKDYHIDASKFPYLRVSGDGITWQIDFHDDMNETGAHICMWEIYYWDEKKSIMQRCISIN